MKVLSDNSELTVSVVKSVQSKQRSLSEKTPSVSDKKTCENAGTVVANTSIIRKTYVPHLETSVANVGNQIIFLLSVVDPDPSSPRGQSGQ